MAKQVELNIADLSDIETYYKNVSPDLVDLSKLKGYEKMFLEIDEIPKSDVEKLAMHSLRAMDIAASYYYVAKRLKDYAHMQYDKLGADVYFNKIPELLKKNDVKDTDAARKRFLDADSTYLEAKDKENAWEALSVYLLQKREDFLQKHMWVKKKIDIFMADKW